MKYINSLKVKEKCQNLCKKICKNKFFEFIYLYSCLSFSAASNRASQREALGAVTSETFDAFSFFLYKKKIFGQLNGVNSLIEGLTGKKRN